MYVLRFATSFPPAYKKVIKGNVENEKRVKKALKLMRADPMYPSLKTHKANTKNYGEKWSSWVTGDIRIVWDYDSEERLVIILLDIGKHSDTYKVYT